MKYGVCRPLESAKIVSEIGFDYIEIRFQSLVDLSESETAEQAKILEKTGIQCEAANCFIPGELALNNGNPDYKALADYIENGMKNGSKLGLKTVVFGSGGARRVAEGGNSGDMFKTLSYFLKECAAPIADKYGIVIVNEPLCHKECNIINTVAEGVALASLCGAPNVKGLADLYHMAVDNDSCENIKIAKDWIYHGHIANPTGRRYPLDINEYPYGDFIDALNFAGCERCSVEANTDNFEADAEKALAVLRQL